MQHGLSAEELSAETLYPGDTIEYFSMAFVNGDPRGHRVAKVLRVLRDEPEYPLRLESQEMLPITLMIRRKRDRHDDEIDAALAKWRKIRTFKLVVGEVKGLTRADRLNEGLRRSMASALQAAKVTLAAQSGDGRREQPDNSGGGGRPVATAETAKLKKQPNPPPKADRFQQQKLSFGSHDSARERGSSLTKRASLESASAKRPPSASSSSSRSDRRPQDDKPRAAFRHKQQRPLPSPSRARAHRDDSLRRLKAGGKRPLKESKYAGADQRRPPPRKLALTKFVDHLEEEMAHATTLNEYLELDKKKSAMAQSAQPPASVDESSSSAAGHQRKQRARLRKAPGFGAMADWLVGGQKSAPSTPPGPPKRQSSAQPRSSPDRQKSPRGISLSFVMANGSNSHLSSHVMKEKTRPGRDDDERRRKRKRSSDFASP